MLKNIEVHFNVIFIKKLFFLIKMNDIKQSKLSCFFFLLQVFSALMKDGLKETDKSSSSPALRS